ncbi:MAG: hypothetical protein ACRDTJ_20930, partial [Pseudonocardiaceae bacterium]
KLGLGAPSVKNRAQSMSSGRRSRNLQGSRSIGHPAEEWGPLSASASINGMNTTKGTKRCRRMGQMLASTQNTGNSSLAVLIPHELLARVTHRR